MQKFKKWSIFIDPDQDNQALIDQIAKLADRYVPRQLSFIAIENKEELPKELLADLPDLIETTSKEKIKSLEFELTNAIHPDHDVRVVQHSNKKIGQLLKKVGEQQTDLLIMINRKGTGVENIYQRIARKTGASVLLLKEGDELEWDKVTVPVDLSIYSDLSITLINEMFKEQAINYLHAYQDSSRYLNQVFETVDEVNTALNKASMVNQKLEKYAITKFKDYLAGQVNGIYNAQLLEYGRDKKPAEVIRQAAGEMQTNFMILGSKGNGKSIASLMGNTADEMVKNPTHYSTLIIKQKGENKGFLKTFLP
jgi:nucleotide-binding universal stress UspA family protein